MKKKTGPDLNKWKEFRYNLIKEDINDYEIVDNSAQEEEIANFKKYFIENIFPEIEKWATNIEEARDAADDTSWYSGLIKFIGELYTIIKKAGLNEMPKYEIPEDIEVDADREEDLQNWMNEPDEPFTYQLKNGKTLEVEEEGGPGMAGEPMTFTILKVDGKTVDFDDIKHLMQPNDAKELEQYLDEVGDSNEASAINWVREGKNSKYFDIAKWREAHKK